MRFLIVALAVGFFVVLVLAWYHGEKGAQRVTGTQLLILALLLTIGGAVALRFAPPTAKSSTAEAEASSTPAAVAQKSIAVLAFTDLSPKHDQDYFSDGMAQAIVSSAAGEDAASIHARLQNADRKNAKLKMWAIADAVEAALSGNRAEANRQATALDARPAGGLLLAILVSSCQCGAVRP